MKTKRYEVQTRMGNTWENCWTEDGTPQTFATRADARAELRQFIKDAKACLDGYDNADYRVAEVGVA
jgi:hypothetical protein